jgi:S1-C subfamily serine protease
VKARPNVGIVNIYTTLGYEQGRAAGTGMIISRSGEVLTNNHVIRGRRSSRSSTSRPTRYSATVVGYSVSRDIAVLQLAPRVGLQTVKRGGAIPLHVGMRVVARGNAQGRGGPPKTARGRIIALHQQIFAEDESGDSETLNNVIATNAPVVAGLLRRAAREQPEPRLGIVTAGSTSGVHRGFAIPLKQALQIVRRIESGKSNAIVHVGPDGLPRCRPRGRPGRRKDRHRSCRETRRRGRARQGRRHHLTGRRDDLVEADVRQTVLMLVPGKAVPIGWKDTNGIAHTGTITPISGPPQ